MNLSPLFKTQKTLDDKIVAEKGLEGQDLLDKKILALQVELGELANEFRGFKFWSEDQEPRTVIYKNIAMKKVKKNPLLEEYVDCLHFILSIGNDIGMSSVTWPTTELVNYTTLDSFDTTFYQIAQFSNHRTSLFYGNILTIFIHLGKRLGFTWQQIEQAYYDKNKVNHERQSNGY